MSRDDYLDMLAKVPLFAGCSKKELKEISHLADRVDVPAGKVLCHQGSVGHECFVIIEGSVDVIIDGEKVRSLGAGDYFGEMSLLSHAPRTATVTSSEEAHLLVLGAREFATALDDIPGLAARLLYTLAARFRQLGERSAQAPK